MHHHPAFPIYLFCIFTLVVFTFSCDKIVEPNFGPPPKLGSKCRIYLNGNHVSYEPLIINPAGTNYIDYRFIQFRDGFQNVLKPFVLSTNEVGDLRDSVWILGQGRGSDSGNHFYKQIYPDRTRFMITELDTTTSVIKCEFDVWLARISSGVETYESYLPDTLHFEGVIDTTLLRF
jgi:hypothetical protein